MSMTTRLCDVVVSTTHRAMEIQIMTMAMHLAMPTRMMPVR